MHACLGQRQPYCMLEADAIMRGLSIFYIYAYAATTCHGAMPTNYSVNPNGSKQIASQR